MSCLGSLLSVPNCGAMAFTFMSVLVLLAATVIADVFLDCVNGPLANNTVCDTSASVGDRARALIAALTIDEKFNLTGNTSPGVPRLGLDSYQWWRVWCHPTALLASADSFPRGSSSWSRQFSRSQLQRLWQLLARDVFPPANLDGSRVRRWIDLCCCHRRQHRGSGIQQRPQVGIGLLDSQHVSSLCREVGQSMALFASQGETSSAQEYRMRL